MIIYLCNGNKKEKEQQKQTNKEYDVEEPNLYNLIEQLIIEKQEMRKKITLMETQIKELQQKITHINQQNNPMTE